MMIIIIIIILNIIGKSFVITKMKSTNYSRLHTVDYIYGKIFALLFFDIKILFYSLL